MNPIQPVQPSDGAGSAIGAGSASGTGIVADAEKSSAL
jgi:hypothetical protein